VLDPTLRDAAIRPLLRVRPSLPDRSVFGFYTDRLKQGVGKHDG